MKHSIFIRSDGKDFETFKMLHLKFINGEW